MKKSEVASTRFLVLGAARSGIAAARLLKSHGADVVVADSQDADKAADNRKTLADLGVQSVWGSDVTSAIIDGFHVLVKSPGITQSNLVVAAAREAGVRIISEIELASAFVPTETRVVAITGTNGKTTTTAWLTHVLAEAGLNAVSAGNIGDAWCNQIVAQQAATYDRAQTVYVVEVSSFQFENIEDFRPDIAILTNITPDHMDRYDDRMDLYVAAKANITRNMGPDDILVWKHNDTHSQTIVEQSRARTLAYSAGTQGPGDLGAWVNGEQIFIQSPAGSTAVLPVSDLPIPGEHNLENALCVALAASWCGLTPDQIAAGLRSFTGVEHRIELCGTRADGLRYYNDSKATNLDATEKAIIAFEQPMILIAGGRDAKSDYTSIAHLIKKHVSHLVTLGEAAELIETAWGDIVPTQRATSMADAVARASEVASPRSVVVFSPACKSFDMYNNYEERGEAFKQAVAEYLARAT